jgi:hypothetical protein
MVNWPLRSMTVSMVVAVLILVLFLASGVLGGARSLGSALFLAAGFIFFSMKVVVFWFIRRRVANSTGPVLVRVREWQILSIGYLVSSGFFLLAGTVGGERPWAWFGALGSAALAWVYFVASREEASNNEAA